MIKVGSDFSGVGAFDFALGRITPFETIFACDWDKYARQSYIANHGEPKYYPKDVYDREIPSESLDIYMTSPPCQSFSLAGKRLGKDDKRGILFFNSHEFIQKNKPRFFIFENVKGLLSDDEGNTFQEWVNMLGGKSVNGLPILFPYDNSVPYHLYWQVLNSKKHGVPQNRERVFLVGIRDDEDNQFQFPKEEHLTTRLKNVLESEVDEKYFLSDTLINGFLAHNKRHIEEKNQDGFNWKPKDETQIANCLRANASLCPTDNTIKIKSATNSGYETATEVIQINPSLESGGVQPYMQNRIYDINGINPALTTLWNGGNLINTYKIRRLTPRECFRLQDFPDTFKFVVSDSQLHKQAGNSITVRVLEKILRNLKL